MYYILDRDINELPKYRAELQCNIMDYVNYYNYCYNATVRAL